MTAWEDESIQVERDLVERKQCSSATTGNRYYVINPSAADSNFASASAQGSAIHGILMSMMCNKTELNYI